VAGFCTVIVVSGDGGKLAEVKDLLMITFPTTSCKQQNNLDNLRVQIYYNILTVSWVLKALTISMTHIRISED
jgi:hypothetical protein